MTDFKFLHAADLHLGSPFHGLSLRDEAVAKRFAEASRAAFTALVARALDEKVAFVVIAGDIYDADWRDNTVGLYLYRELSRLDRAGIPVFLLKGDHDAENVVIRSVALPASARYFESEAPSTFRIEALKVALHGQSFPQRVVTENLVLRYPNQVAGWFNIGVLHTALTGRPPHEDFAPATAGHLRARGYDYWALGHSHDHELVQVSPHIVYSGNLQGRNMREKGEKGAVLVSVVDGEIKGFERVIVDRVRWMELTVDAGRAASEAALLKLVEDRVRGLGVLATERLIVLRVVLMGETDIHRQLVSHRERLAAEVQAACHHVHGDIWLERLEVRTTAPRGRALASKALLSIDLSALLAEVDGSPELSDQALKSLAEIRSHIPGTIAEDEQLLEEELPQLIAEARELLLSRAADET